MTDAGMLRRVWEAHPRFRYRGCAPDVDYPSRAAGDLSLSLDAWLGEDRDGSEPQREREARQAAAIEVCLGCPVMVQCDAYANAVVLVDGRPHLAEPSGVWGGRTALERHRAFIRHRHEVARPAPAGLVMTVQRRAVLVALAVHVDPERVAVAAGVDVRTANWQRRRLVTMLALPSSVSRVRLLDAAVGRGLLDAAVVVRDDGRVPAVPPPSSLRPTVPTSEPLISRPLIPHGRIRRHHRWSRVVRIPGQLEFFPAEAVLASVISLYTSEPMEAAA